MGAMEDVVDLLGHTTRFAVPCPEMQDRVLVPETSNLKFLGILKTRKRRLFSLTVSAPVPLGLTGIW